MTSLTSKRCNQVTVFYGCNNFGELLMLCDGTIPLLQICYGDDNKPSLGYHLTFEIKSETSAVNPTILVNLYTQSVHSKGKTSVDPAEGYCYWSSIKPCESKGSSDPWRNAQ